MRVICERNALLNAINLVSGVVVSRTPRPQLTCVKLVAEKSGKAGRLTLSATDAEVSLTLRTDRVDVEQTGAALVPADKLAQIVRAEEHEPTLTLDAEGDTTHIRGADAHFQLKGFLPEEFPAIPTLADARKAKAATFTNGTASTAELVRRTLFAASRENSRYAINGVLVKRDGKKLEFVATDGRRLALARAQLSDAGGEAVSCIVPSKALNLLSKLIDSADEPVTMAVTDTQIVFAIGAEPGAGDADARAVLTSTLVEGTFPPYEDVIPKDQDIKATFDRDVLASAVRRAALLTSEESRGVRFSFSAGDKKLELSSRVPEMGEARITVDVTEYAGADIEIGFNPGYLTEALRVVEETAVAFELKAANKPGLVRSGNDFLYVVMPVNLP